MAMQAKFMVPAFTLLAVSVSAVAADFVACPSMDDKETDATLLPNPYNCSTFYLCSQGAPQLIECPHALKFNNNLNVCDFPWRAACVELPIPEPALPTTEAPLATERVVITKIVTEIFRPVEEQAAPS
nr:peritrophin-1-like [Rhipicephalus microplus]XP_037279439.1 peritrophin-1-like [Rhipicephalus microplus]